MVASTLPPDLLDTFIHEVRKRTGVHLEGTKATMLSGRLRRRVRSLGLDGFEDYLHYLRRHPAEQKQFVHAVTTHKTDLFRTKGIWQYLWDEYLPTTRRRVRAWSGACSTGEEPASLGVILQEWADENPGFRYDILATDISEPVVHTAKEALFSKRAVQAAGSPFGRPVQKWFEEDDGDMRLTRRIRNATSYRTHNLFEPMRATFDLVLIRNVIIYFTAEDKARVVRHAAAALAPKGLLVVGESESLMDLVPELEMVGHCLYRKSS